MVLLLVLLVVVLPNFSPRIGPVLKKFFHNLKWLLEFLCDQVHRVFLFVSHTIRELFRKNLSGITVTSAPVSNRKLMILLQTFVVTFIFVCHFNSFIPLTELIFFGVIEPRKSLSFNSLTSDLF